ncbi:hypothetical protein [Nocardia sp. NPDC050406]|uniref:hypothetical protein n=1 Tax=Nocardia sp. NPDC050406 TaxID=3364318 RepID=UPI0037B136AD
MATREITVTVSVDGDEWDILRDAAECAGMSVEAYLRWSVRLVALRSRPGRALRPEGLELPRARRGAREVDEPEAVAWAETFTERLSHRTEQFRND